MRVSQLGDFIAVVEAGSIRGAARGLGVSQPAMTKSMRQLEDELHVRLFERTTQGIVPTVAGRAFLARARAVQAELRKGEEELAELAGDRGGTVAFGAGPVSGVLLVPKAVADFRRVHPLAHVRIVEGIPQVLLPLVRDETLDFVVGRRRVTKLDAGIRYRPLYGTPLVVAARRGHPLREATSLGELAEAAWLTYSSQDVLHEAFATARLPPPRSVIRCESYLIQIGILRNSDALALLARQTLGEPYGREFLQEIPIRDQIPTLMVGIFTRAHTRLAPIAAAMAKAMTSAARGLASSGLRR